MPKLKKKSYNQKRTADKNRKQELPKVLFNSTASSPTQQGRSVPTCTGQVHQATIPTTSQRGQGQSGQSDQTFIVGNKQSGEGQTELAHPATFPATSQSDQNRQNLRDVPLSSTAGSQTQQGNTVPYNSGHTLRATTLATGQSAKKRQKRTNVSLSSTPRSQPQTGDTVASNSDDISRATIPSQRGQGHCGQAHPTTFPATSQSDQKRQKLRNVPLSSTAGSQTQQGNTVPYNSSQTLRATTLATGQSVQKRQKRTNVPLSSTAGSQTQQGNSVPYNSSQTHPAAIPATSQRSKGHCGQADPVTIPATSQRSQCQSGQACQITIPDTSQRGQQSAENVTTPLNINNRLSIQPSGLHEQSFHGINREDLMNGEMSIQIADYASHILRLQFNCHTGLFPPSYLYGLSLHPRIHLQVDIRIPRTIDAVQIHYAQGHFVVSHQINGRLFVYDSLHNFGHMIAIEKQLRILYENVKMQEIQYRVWQSQGATNLCGFFALANTFSLLSNRTPQFFDATMLRQHVNNCLQEAQFTDFPRQPRFHKVLANNNQNQTNVPTYHKAKTDEEGKKIPKKSANTRFTPGQLKFITRSCNLHQKQTRNERTSGGIENNKLKDQQRKKQARVQHTEEQIKDDRLRDQQRKKKSRRQRTDQQIKEDKQRDQRRKKQARAQHTDHQIEEDKQKNQKRKKQARAQHTDHQIEEDKQRDQLRKKQARAQYTDHQIEEDKQRDQRRKKQARAQYTDHQIEEDKQRDQRRKKQARAQHTDQQIEDDKQRDQQRRKQARAQHTDHQIEEDKQRDQQRKKQARAQYTDHQIEEDKQRDQKRKKHARAQHTDHQIEEDKHRDQQRKKQARAQHTDQQIEEGKQRDQQRKKQARAQNTDQQIEEGKQRDQQRKKQERAQYTDHQIEEDKQRDQRRKKQARAQYTDHQIEEDKQRDQRRKKQARAQHTDQQIEDDKQRDQQRKKQARAQYTDQQIEDDKQRDQQRKKQARAQYTDQQIEDDKQRDQQRKKQARAQHTDQQIEEDKQRDQQRKKGSRRQRGHEQIEEDKHTDKTRKHTSRHPTDIEQSILKFRTNIKSAPEYVCTVCHRSLYRKSVQKFNRNCDISRTTDTNKTSPNGKQYICCTCQRHIKKRKIPPQAQINKMSLPDTPDVLSQLTEFETRLLAKRYPFMKIVQLPKGKQRGIIGRVVNVPVDANDVCTSLPRTLSTSGILPVKLKRKTAYKGHVRYENIRPEKIRQAFQWLLQNNRHYQNVVERFDWDSTSEKDSPDVWKSFIENEGDHSQNKHDDYNSDTENLSQTQSSDSESSDSDSSDEGLQLQAQATEETKFDTCIQPNDPAADSSNILSIAPGEGKHPLHVMMDPGCEEQSFPSLFPTGCFGFDADRETKLTPKKYFNARILNSSGNFSRSIDYLFFAQYVTEHKQVMDSASIAIRKSYRALPSEHNIDASFVKDPDKIKSLILKDNAYHFLQTIRGSPPYWQKCMYKLMAAVKQFGIFTFFLTLSSADLKWPDTLNAILRQEGKQLDDEQIENLSWEEKTTLLRSNPVTTARHFEHRLNCFFNDILFSSAQPLGKITHYSYRIEFQQRGSPHAHCVIWVENAPKITDPIERIADFIDQYITCKIPSQEAEPDLYNLVTTVQKHHHTHTCRKKGTICRFHFPKLPSPYTLIACALESDDNVFKSATLETASDILTNIYNTLEDDKDNNIDSLDELLQKTQITLQQYVYALSITKRGKTVVLQRQIDELWINPYNPSLLIAWQANLDVQYCLDPYACIAYMVSYITKDEREMSTVLKNVSKEMYSQDWREQLKACAKAFLNAREISAQEAVYRLLSLPLFKSNFSAVFVPAELPENRVSFLKSMSTIACMDDEDEDIFTTSIIDRYAARPQQLEDMCLAHFAVTYSPNKTRALPDSDDENPEQIDVYIELQNNLGTMKRNSKQSVLRYHHHSKLKEPEKYYYSQLLLFLPWLVEENLLQLPSYQEHYEHNSEVIESNQSEIEHHVDIITQAVEHYEEFGPPLHAFDSIAPSTVQENEDDHTVVEDEQFAILNPSEGSHVEQTPADFPVTAASCTSSIEIRPGFWTEDRYCGHIRHLNKEQRDTFQTVSKWCQQTVQFLKGSDRPDQLLLFISGGAGTGKSHLISAIYQMALRTLQTEGQNPDDIHVLLTAPTGTAAHNISGTTLHSAFLLPLGQTKSFTKLGDDKRNTLRSKLGHLQLLIVDEISMVGCNLLLQLHYRLTEIMSSTKLFGGVSVIVLGDLFQLQPVKQKFIFKPVSDHLARLHGSLWNCFLFTELITIMRQKEDLRFAELLNRIRTDDCTEDDLQILKGREVSDNEELSSYLHVYATNRDVDEFNSKQLARLKKPIETFLAVDRKPESLKNIQLSKDPKYTGGLPSEVVLALGARVMLTRNLDVVDGLVNGAQGQIVAFIKTGKGDTVAVAVKFDHQNTGKNARQNSPYVLQLNDESTPILRVETSFTVSRKNKNLTVARYQFPLKLAWACTIHKVQGLTTDNIVVSFDGRFGGGQGYVALSRARTLSGLHIINLNTRKLKINKDVQKEMERLRANRKMPLYYNFFSILEDFLVLCTLNIRSFPCHKQDLISDPIAVKSDVIVLTETWLNNNNADFSGFPDIYYFERSDKHSEHGGRGGGVAILAKYTAFTSFTKISSYSDHLLQILTCELKSALEDTIYVIAVYNSPSADNTHAHLETHLLAQVQQIYLDKSQPACIVVTGDFNQNALADPTPQICQSLSAKGFQQYVHTSTHSLGSCLDHLYLSGLLGIRPTTTVAYYSDHTWVSCGIGQQL